MNDHAIHHVLVAQQDNSDVVSVDPSSGRATVGCHNTNTGGAASINEEGAVFVAERGLHQSINEVAPEHKVLPLCRPAAPASTRCSRWD